MQRNETRTLLHSHTQKISSDNLNDLNATPESIKLLEENIGHMLFDICLNITGYVSQAEKPKKRKEKGYIKLSLHGKRDYVKRKNSLLNGKEIAYRIADKRLIPQIHKSCIQLSNIPVTTENKFD